jgi:hypothetical protein
VQPAVTDESDGNDDVDLMDDLVANIRRGYDLESEDPLLEVPNFYNLLPPQKKKCTMAPKKNSRSAVIELYVMYLCHKMTTMYSCVKTIWIVIDLCLVV